MSENHPVSPYTLVDIIKKRKKKRVFREHSLTPEQLLSQTIQEAHQQTGLKNFPEAVRLYSLAIDNIEESSEHSLHSNNQFLENSASQPLPPKQEDLLFTPTPLYVLLGCRAQAYIGMQQFELALKDANQSIHLNPKHTLGYARKGKALYELQRYKEALRCYEEGLKADPNHCGLRRLVENLTQELQGTSITSSVSCLPRDQPVDQEELEREVEENYEADLRAERRARDWEIVPCTGTELLRPRHAYASALCASQHVWYIFGGYGDRGEYMGDFYCFYFPSRTWYKLPVEGENTPKPKHSASMVAVDSKKQLYLFGGTSEIGYLEELHAFDLQSRTWRVIKPVEGQPWPAKRWSHASVYCPKRNAMYVFGGVSSALSMLNDLWRFDIDTEKWTKLEPKSDSAVPAPRHVHTLSLYNDSLYVYAGFGGRVNFHDLYRYDLKRDCWELVSDTVIGRRGHAAVVHEKSLFIFGGRGKNGNSSSTFRCSLEDGEIEEIETINRPTARHYVSAALWGGSMWVFGGSGRANYNDVLRFWLSSPGQKGTSRTSSIGQDLSILVNHTQFSDVAFILKGNHIAYGLRAILYARCEHFRGMFDSGMKESQQHPQIDLSHIEYVPFVALLNWIYTGRIDESIEGDVALQLLELADQFLLPELRRHCAHVIRRFITPDNVRDILLMAEIHNSPQLQIFCQQYIETL